MFALTHEDELAVMSRADLLAEVRDAEREIGRQRARQLRALRELGRRSWAPAMSASSLAADLDVSTDTARSLLDTARHTPELSPQMAKLEAGERSFDRTSALAALQREGADEQTMDAALDRDIAGVHRLRSLARRVRRRDERRAHDERALRSWPSLDQSVGFIHAQLPAFGWQVVNQALDARTDRFPAQARELSRDQRRADALVAIAQEWLDGVVSSGRSPGPIVTVVVDAAQAARTDCEAGVGLTGGPRIGPDTLDGLLCEGAVEIVIDSETGAPLAVGPTTRVVPPKIRRFVLARDGGCTVDGCSSRYRLEVHHIVPRSRGGTHDPENLTTLCWWHHHVAVHGSGGAIDPASPPLRRRIIPARDPPE